MFASSIYRLEAGPWPIPRVASVAAGVALVLLVYRTLRPTRYPKDLPRVGERMGISWKSMRQTFQTNCLAVFEEAYQHVSRD